MPWTTTIGLSFLKNGSNMGYYTYYQIAFEGEEQKVEAFKKDLLEESKGDDGTVDDDLERLLKFGWGEAKLYDIEDWIDEVAPKHPDVLVILDGDGENSDDLWEIRWKGNNSERQDAKIPPFENEDLRTDSEKISDIMLSK